MTTPLAGLAPATAVGRVRDVARKAIRRARLFLRGETAHSYFDIHDADLVNRLFRRFGEPPIRGRVADAIRAADAAVGEAVFDLRPDVREVIPLALTPAQRGDYLRWYLESGRADHDASPLDLLRALADLDATPDRGLARTYLTRPDWQERFPNALTPSGWDGFRAWIAAEYGTTGRWLRAARPRFQTGPWREQASEPGAAGQAAANVIALFRYPSGLQQAAYGMVESLTAAGVRTELRDVPMPTTRDGRTRDGFLGLEPHPVTILNTGLDLPVPEAYRLAGLHPRPGVSRVAVWWWELEEVPTEWRDRGRDVDEVWAPTRFIADALRVLGKPVYPMLPAVRLPAFGPRPKAFFGLSPEKFTFLFVFDMNSRLPRKNPVSLIRAFRRAFRWDEPVELVIKVGPQTALYPEWWRELRTAAGEAGVTILDRSLSRSDLLALMNAADAYASLHRSEGFGLTMAEAMLLGKPTVGTAYSGNLDFMTPENSYLVDYDRVALAEDAPPYPKGCVWAEPSVEHAAELMRRVYRRRNEARDRGERARADLQRLLSPEAAGARMKARLDSIRAARREAA